MKKFVLVFALFVFIGTASASDVKCLATNEQHYILIHGIGANEKTFGVMKDTLPRHLDCATVHEYIYATKDSRFAVENFAKGLDDFLRNLKIAGTNKNINLIMHSQGGLIGLKWLMNAYRKKSGYTFSLTQKINHYITLSTPFWGSDFALLGRLFFFSLGVDNNIISPFGKKQLIQMQYGHPVYIDNFKTLANSPGMVEFFNTEIKMLNIAGLGPYSKRLMGAAIGGSQFFEGDWVVNIPSMKSNYLYGSLKDDYFAQDEETVEVKDIRLAQQAKVKGLHLDFVPKVGAYGIADVGKNCFDLARCDHPGYLSLLEFIRSGKVKTDNDIEDAVQGFDLHIIVEFDKSLEKPEKLELEIFPTEEMGISLNLKGEQHTPTPNRIDGNKAFFIIKGSMLDSRMQVEDLRFKITHKKNNIIERNITTSVERGRVSFLETTVKVNESNTCNSFLCRFFL